MGVPLIRVRLVPIPAAARDARLLAGWAELEREALEPNPFFAPQAVLPAARHLRGGASAALLLAESADRLQFLLPVTGRPGLGGVALPWLRTWMHDYCFLGTPLLSAHADPDRTWAAVQAQLRRHGRARLLALPLHGLDGPAAAALDRADAGHGLGVRRSPAAVRGFVQRRPEPTYATEWMARKHRANLTRRRRHLERLLGGPVQAVDRAAGDLDPAVEGFLRLEASGWKRRNGTALACRPGHDRFFRELSRGFAEQGRLMFLSLEAGGRVLAQSTALLGGPGLFGFKKAYDEEFGRWSPGTLLDLEVLAWFHQRSRLGWLDTCSAPDGAGGGLFGDRRATRTLLVPLGPPGGTAAAMAAASLQAHRRLRDSGVYRRLQHLARRTPDAPGDRRGA